MRNAILSLLAFTAIASAQDSAPQFRSAEVSPGIFMIDGAEGFVGGNVTLLVGAEYAVLIDDVMPHTVSGLVQKAAEIAERPIDFVINTHAHGDHAGGNERFAAEGTIVVAHDNVRRFMVSDTSQDSGPGAIPVLTFSDQMTFNVNGHTAFVFHIENAHTDGDAAILFREANVLSTGDLLFQNMFPFIDLDNGGSVDGYIDGQQKILSVADENTIIIPGHGVVASKADLETHRTMLIDALARIRALVDQGMSEKQILEANPLAPYEKYSWSFITTERMTKTIFRSLTTE